MLKKGNFALIQEDVQGGVKLTVKGRIDSNNALELELKLGQAIRSGRTNITLNMFQVEYLCSAGIRAILKAYKNAKEAGGKFRIESPSECVKNVLGMAALNEMLV